MSRRIRQQMDNLGWTAREGALLWPSGVQVHRSACCSPVLASKLARGACPAKLPLPALVLVAVVGRACAWMVGGRTTQRRSSLLDCVQALAILGQIISTSAFWHCRLTRIVKPSPLLSSSSHGRQIAAACVSPAREPVLRSEPGIVWGWPGVSRTRL